MATTPSSLFYTKQQNNMNERLRKQKEEEMAGKLTNEDVARIFAHYDKNGDGSISVKELIEVFKQLGVDISDTEKVKSIITSLDADEDGIVTKENFISWWFSSDILTAFDSGVRSLLFLYGMDFVGQKSDELHAFAGYLNVMFKETNGNDRYFPIDPADGGHDILSKLVDGVLLAKMINIAVPNAIDERVLHFRDDKTDIIKPKQIVENLNIVLSSCKAIGVDFGSFADGTLSVEKFLDPSNYEDIIRQILSELSKIHLSQRINLKDNPVLIRLANVFEDDETIKNIKSAEWLKRWINYQLKRSGEDRRIKRFGKDFRDGAVLSLVLDSVTKRKKKKIERFDVNKAFQQPTYARPGYILKVLAQQFNLNVFLTANDILSGNRRLITLLCAQIFTKFKGMRKISKAEQQQVDELFADDNEKSENVKQNNEEVKQQSDNVRFAENYQKAPKYKKGDWDVRRGKSLKHRRANTKSTEFAEQQSKEFEQSEENKEEELEEEDIRRERDLVKWINEIFSASQVYDRRMRKNQNKILKINNLTRDIKDGLVLLIFMDLLAPNVVNWDVVMDEENELSKEQCLSNCHYVISLIKKEPFCSSFFGVEQFPSDGNDIFNASTSVSKQIIFKICHNLINFHYVHILTQFLGHKATEYDILFWLNKELKTRLKYPRFCSFDEKKLHSFGDETLKSCLYYIDLLLMLMDDPKNDINRNEVIHKNNRKFPNDDYTKAECLSNARYALSIARKFGAIFYISPFDLVKVKMPEITMSFAMCIMVLILTKQKKIKNQKRASEIKQKDAEIKGVIVDTLHSHLDQEKNDNLMSDDDVEDMQKMFKNAKHSKTRSVLQDYGIVVTKDDLKEFEQISKQYSAPNIATPDT